MNVNGMVELDSLCQQKMKSSYIFKTKYHIDLEKVKCPFIFIDKFL